MSVVVQSRGELRAHPSGVEESWLRGTFWGGASTASGQAITPDSALSLVPVFAAIRVLAETIGTLPLITYQKTPAGRERAIDHPWYEVLRSQPNPEMSSVVLREMLILHLMLRGNAYLQIVPMTRGGMQIWPLHPDRVMVDRDSAGQLRYAYRQGDATQPVVLSNSKVIHIRLLSKDGIFGLSPITLAREEIGLGLATRTFGAALFGNGSMPGGVLQMKNPISPEAAARLKKDWEDLHRGGDNAHRVAVLEEGMTWQQVGLAPEDAQFLETRQFNKFEIATLFRVPPHMIGELSRSTFSNIEHQSIEFVVHTVRPLAVRIEQAIYNRLFAGTDYFAEFLLDGLLRGDIASRYRAYAIGRQWGWLSVNEIRESENLNRLPADEGDTYLVPLNMIPADQLGDPTQPDAPAAARTVTTAKEIALLGRGGGSDDDTD